MVSSKEHMLYISLSKVLVLFNNNNQSQVKVAGCLFKPVSIAAILSPYLDGDKRVQCTAFC